MSRWYLQFLHIFEHSTFHLRTATPAYGASGPDMPQQGQATTYPPMSVSSTAGPCDPQ